MPGPEMLCVYHVLNARQERIVKVIPGASARVTSSEPWRHGPNRLSVRFLEGANAILLASTITSPANLK